MEGQPVSPKGRKVAILVAAGVDVTQVAAMQKALKAVGAMSDIVGPHLGAISGRNGASVEANKTFANTASVLYDAVYLPGGQSVFLAQAYKHAKTVAATGEGVDLLMALLPQGTPLNQMGVVAGGGGMQQSGFIQQFVTAIGFRHWGRPGLERISA